ncbi:hypothetical protein AAC387_Pa01g1281 [Persea americana]
MHGIAMEMDSSPKARVPADAISSSGVTQSLVMGFLMLLSLHTQPVLVGLESVIFLLKRMGKMLVGSTLPAVLKRLAIAKALHQNSSMLILDEATSALDNRSEQLVRQALERLMVNHTVS